MRINQQAGGAIYAPPSKIVIDRGKPRVVDNTYHAPKPVYHAPKPIYHAPKPVYHAPKPVYHAPKVVSAVKAPAPTVSTPAPAPQPDTSYQDQLNAAFDARKQAQIDEFKANRDAAIAGINGQIDNTRQDFYDKRNQADTVAMQNAQRLREVMAANGLNASGENVTANVGLQSARQGAINGLNVAEGQQVGALNQKIADLNNPARLNAITQQIESERSQAITGAIQQSKDQAWREYTYNHMSATDKAQLAQNASQFGENIAWQRQALKMNLQSQSDNLDAQLSQYPGFNSSSGGGDYQSNLAQAVKLAHIPANQLGAFNWIIQHESSFNPNALNKSSGTYGYGQFQDYNIASYDKKMGLDYKHNPVDQLVETYQYMNDRYGSPAKAMLFWKQHGWY